jgi:hypothetical protein
MITSASIIDIQTDRDRRRDRALQIRSRLLCALEDAGRAMSPRELAQRTGLGVAIVTINADSWRAYFVCAYRGKGIVDSIDRHPHIKAGE